MAIAGREGHSSRLPQHGRLGFVSATGLCAIKGRSRQRAGQGKCLHAASGGCSEGECAEDCGGFNSRDEGGAQTALRNTFLPSVPMVCSREGLASCLWNHRDKSRAQRATSLVDGTPCQMEGCLGVGVHPLHGCIGEANPRGTSRPSPRPPGSALANQLQMGQVRG